MVYVEAEDLAELNKLILRVTRFKNDRPHEVKSWPDLRRLITFAKRNYQDDPFRQAAFLSCSIIAYHPFADANHRTSLYAGILHCMMNGYLYGGAKEREVELYIWRFEYEREHNLESRWCYELGSWENPSAAEAYLRELTLGPYGQKMEAFLRAHCRAVPIHIFVGMHTPHFFYHVIGRYPKATRVAARRWRRAHASRLRHAWKQYDKGRKRMRKRTCRPSKNRGRIGSGISAGELRREALRGDLR